MPNVIDQGETIILRASFTDANGDPASPATPVNVTIRTPDGTVESPVAATQVDTGVFELEYQPTLKGDYLYKFETSDGAIEQSQFFVHPDNII